MSKFEFMKTMPEINNKKKPTIRIDNALDKFDNIVLFPDKLAKANENIRKTGFPKLPDNKQGK